MATVVPTSELKLAPQGKLTLCPLDALLGRLGLLKATAVVDLTNKKLVRRLILEDGCVQALISNARDDRFVDWWLSQGGGAFVSDQQREQLLADCGNSPSTAAAVVRSGSVDGPAIERLLVEHLLAMAADMAGWTDATYRITPGRVALGEEPLARWPAIDAALMLARVKIATLRRPPPAPQYVIAYAGWSTDGPAIDELESAMLEKSVDAIRTTLLIDSESSGGDQRERTLAALVRVGLLNEIKPHLIAPEIEAPQGEVSETELKEWLAAGTAENLEKLLGVSANADAAQVRRAYYRTVRRFHPDRFNSGPLASYHAQVELAFRLVHEAHEVLTNSTAREAWIKRRQGPAPADPGKMARDLFSRARRAIAEGRRGEAVDYLQRCVEQPQHELTHALYLWLLLLGNPRRRADAVEHLAQLSRAHPKRADLIAAYGLALQRSGREDEARVEFKRALQLDPTQPIARVASGVKGSFDVTKLDPLLAAIFS